MNLKKVPFCLIVLLMAPLFSHVLHAQSSNRILPNTPLRWLGAGHSPGYHKCNPGHETSYYNPYSHHNSGLIQHGISSSNYFKPSFSTTTQQGILRALPQQNAFQPFRPNTSKSGVLFGEFRYAPVPATQTAPVPLVAPNPPIQVVPPRHQKSPSDENPFSREDIPEKSKAVPDNTTQFFAPKNRRLAFLRHRS